jgi:hypothetical protein
MDMTELSLDAAAPRRSGRTRTVTFRYRFDVMSRSLAAIVGGFVLASGVAVILSALLAQGVQARGAAVTSGTLISWLVWTGGAMWAFYARSHWAAWARLILPGAALWALAVVIGFGG